MFGHGLYSSKGFSYPSSAQKLYLSRDITKRGFTTTLLLLLAVDETVIRWMGPLHTPRYLLHADLLTAKTWSKRQSSSLDPYIPIGDESKK